MKHRVFTKEIMQEIAWNDCKEAEIIEDNIIDTTRWSVVHEIVFKYEGKFYQSNYSKGATEQQDENPYEYDDEFIKCTEVEQKQVLVYQWVEVE